MLYEEDLTIARKRRSASVGLNEDIRFPKVRLIDDAGEMLGIVSRDEALQLAFNKGLDLVLLNPDPQNPVCRIMDYGKYVFEQSKREREARRRQKVTEVKEVQLKLTTEEHDFQVKVKNALRFLNNEDRVKVVIRFRGREMTYQNRGQEVMQQFAEACAEVGKPDRMPKMEGRHMIMYLSPVKAKA